MTQSSLPPILFQYTPDSHADNTPKAIAEPASATAAVLGLIYQVGKDGIPRLYQGHTILVSILESSQSPHRPEKYNIDIQIANAGLHSARVLSIETVQSKKSVEVTALAKSNSVQIVSKPGQTPPQPPLLPLVLTPRSQTTLSLELPTKTLFNGSKAMKFGKIKILYADLGDVKDQELQVPFRVFTD